MILVLPLWASRTFGGDWPTYRGDCTRSGVSAEPLKLPLQEAWVHKAAHPPQPAWPELPAVVDVWHRIQGLAPTTIYDRAYHVAVAAGRLYFGSSAQDAVCCLDAATGQPRWSFLTEGPVRLAPAVANGRVYAGCDDGCLYCLNADTGDLRWKHRPGPEDRRLPGNGRMISLFPIRCGIVVDDGTVYCSAGLFPDQGVYLCALAADSGKEVWKQKLDVSPQGYLLASPTRLFVPTGRTAPSVYERADGKGLGSLPGSGVDGRAGGGFAVLVGDTVVHSSGEAGGLSFSVPGSKEKIMFTAGQQLLAKGSMAYIYGRDRLLALDWVQYFELSRLQNKKDKTAEEQKRLTELGGAGRAFVKWEVPCPATYEIALAGETIFAGGDSRVAAYSTAGGNLLWSAVVWGKAYGLAVAGDALYVSTDQGLIYCFQNTADPDRAPLPTEPLLPGSPYADDPGAPRHRQVAELAIQTAGVKQGYCLVLGAGTGQLAYEIARRSQFQVIGLEPDSAQAATARRLLSQVGLYGTRISIHQGPLEKLPYPRYFANLIIADMSAVGGKLPLSAAEVFRVLRPCGGALVVAQPPGGLDAAALQSWGQGEIPGWKTESLQDSGVVGTALRSPLPGTGEWSHFYADSGNSACSQDSMKQGPVDIQWFGRPGPRRMPDRHDKNVGPLYKHGRLFVSGDNYVVAVDAYNGTVLWERDVPDSIRLGAFKHAGNMVATDDRLYLAAGSDCLALDAQTGRQRLLLTVPSVADGRSNEWGYIACDDNILLGSVSRSGAAFRVQDLDTETLIWRDFMPVVCSDTLFARERHTGQELWTYSPQEGVIINPTIAVGGSRIYCVESTNPRSRHYANGRVKLDVLLGQGAKLVALDVRTGKPLWQRAASFAALQHIIYLSYAKETLVVMGTKNLQVENKGRVRYDLHAFDAATGNPLWQNTQTPVPDHILQGGHGEQVQHPAIVGEKIYNTGFACQLRTGEPIAGWKWQKSGHCGVLSTSAECAFSRYSQPRMFDLKTGQYAVLSEATRSGCWINILPAGGLILIPEFSAGCICGYPLQASLALTPR
jgi:outer membrane protein assembly factor BamB